MSKMQTKKNGPGDKVHTIIDKNCTLKQMKNNKVLRSMQLGKKNCAEMREKLKTKNIPASQTDTTRSGSTQTYGTGTAKPAKLSKKQIAVARQNYIKSNDKKAYLQSLPKIAKDALKEQGIK